MLKFLTDRKLQNFYEYIRSGKVEDIRRYLSKAPQDAEAPDRNGKTPLIIAAESGQLEVVELLLKAKVSLNRQDSSAKSALMRAAENGHLQIARLLIQSGADARLRDQNGMNIFTLANSKGQSGLVKELLCEKNPALNDFLENGPGDQPSREAFLWLKKNSGIQVKVTFHSTK